MSMILDAMKRSKEADVQGEVPSVETEHFVASGQTSRLGQCRLPALRPYVWR
jgi:hypothetical protein